MWLMMICIALPEFACALHSMNWLARQVRALIEEVAARHSGDMQTVLIYDDCRRGPLLSQRPL